jgi:hypothetical protein
MVVGVSRAVRGWSHIFERSAFPLIGVDATLEDQGGIYEAHDGLRCVSGVGPQDCE